MKEKIVALFHRFLAYLSLEPGIFLYLMSEGIVIGSGVDKSLVLWKASKLLFPTFPHTVQYE